MPIELVKTLLKQDEGLRLEFKGSGGELPKNLFETVCAFLNHDGGSILLGIDDNGAIKGIDPLKIKQLSKEIASLSNNPNKLDPPFLLEPLIVEISGREIIHIQVPASSQVHRSAGVYFDRSTDGDFRVTHHDKIAGLFSRKSALFSELAIYPALRISDFREGLLDKARNLIRSHNPDHPWLKFNDEQLFNVSGLYRKDYQANKEGFTLAAALLFGKDEVIKNILPHYKIDLLVRIENMDRYDDRLIVETNLIDAYESILSFTAKHLPDKFFMEKDIRISLRDKIFREIAANLVIHREYMNAHPATFTIYTDRVEVLNANKPNGSGPISIKNFSPYPKNPLIAKFFIQLGRADELGSGIVNVTRFLKSYSPGAVPEFIEDYIFRTIIPLSGSMRKTAADLLTVVINEELKEYSLVIRERSIRLINLLIKKERLRAVEIISEFNLSNRTIKNLVAILKQKDIVVFEGGTKSGYYRLSEEFKSRILKAD